MNHVKTLKVVLPSTAEWEIRETNGEDDGILSTMETALTGDNIFIFISNIIVGPTKPTKDEIKEWPVNDIWVMLFKQRLFNQGPEFKFSHKDNNDPQKRTSDYTEDLAPLDGDLGDPSFKPGPNQIFLYPNKAEKVIQIETSSKRKFRFKIMTGTLFNKADLSDRARKNMNSILIDRELEIMHGTTWLPLKSFHEIKSKEMSELRAAVSKYDRQFEPVVEFDTQFTKTPVTIPLMSMATFFFPEEVM